MDGLDGDLDLGMKLLLGVRYKGHFFVQWAADILLYAWYAPRTHRTGVVGLQVQGMIPG
jgi:hypothetical protein